MHTQNPLEYTSIKNKMQTLKRENICDIDDRELSLKDLIMNVEEVEQSDNVGQRRWTESTWEYQWRSGRKRQGGVWRGFTPMCNEWWYLKSSSLLGRFLSAWFQVIPMVTNQTLGNVQGRSWSSIAFLQPSGALGGGSRVQGHPGL
jgi:hypothetical protein